jgi:acylphosphatase
MVKHISILISGRVQGVFFRATTKNKADELGIKGFVKNLGDGSVYIEAEGNQDQLIAFESWCRKGPPRAQVVRMDITEGLMKFFPTFDIH